MFIEYGFISKILYKKDTVQDIYSRFGDVEHMTFNSNAFEKNFRNRKRDRNGQ